MKFSLIVSFLTIGSYFQQQNPPPTCLEETPSVGMQVSESTCESEKSQEAPPVLLNIDLSESTSQPENPNLDPCKEMVGDCQLHPSNPL
jgi:hypothetical protein